MNKELFCLMIALIVLVSCSQKTVPPASTAGGGMSAANASVENDQRVAVKEDIAPATSAKSEEFTAAGKKIYISRCGRCHAMKNTFDYTRQQWLPIMDRMAVKANLSDTEKTEVLLYVQAYAKK